ncbi:hypothetical protein LMG28688_00710 [Paraburkholderia caffeinitolerans]|uniref:Uncharacterized protein n=1 Tax=Paraburkholderia caffeinitolerans TaxID=1723730 RepID=A0A6J5FIF5_9BURK|nr:MULTISPECIES: hypothetical protein [Paraburkholderia]CAB3779079.1 hypothetical protein LMG28688_00710 [Paraburkholderia caffeinitolerans]
MKGTQWAVLATARVIESARFTWIAVAQQNRPVSVGSLQGGNPLNFLAQINAPEKAPVPAD